MRRSGTIIYCSIIGGMKAAEGRDKAGPVLLIDGDLDRARILQSISKECQDIQEVLALPLNTLDCPNVRPYTGSRRDQEACFIK